MDSGKCDAARTARASASALVPLSRLLSLPLTAASHFFLATSTACSRSKSPSSPSSTTCLTNAMDSLELRRSLSIAAIAGDVNV